MIQTTCSNVHPGRGQLGLTRVLSVSASGDLTPGGSLGLTDYYHTIAVQPTTAGIVLTLPVGIIQGYRLMLLNPSTIDLQVTDGVTVWRLEGQRKRGFVFSALGWSPLDCETRSKPTDKVEVRFGIFVTTFAATERAYVGTLDPGDFKLLDTAQPSAIDDAENYAYFDVIGTICHFNFRAKKGGIYLGATNWMDPGLQGFTFALHVDMPSPHRPTSFTSLGYSYSAGGTVPGDVQSTPRDITGIILPDVSDTTKAFILYTYYGQRVLVGDLVTAFSEADYTFFGSGTYRVAA